MDSLTRLGLGLSGRFGLVMRDQPPSRICSRYLYKVDHPRGRKGVLKHTTTVQTTH